MDRSGLALAISAFGAAAKEKLANTGATGNPEDQLRAPLETLMPQLGSAAGLAQTIVLVGETPHAETGTRPDYCVTAGAKAKALIGYVELKAPGKGYDPRKFTDAHDKARSFERSRTSSTLMATASPCGAMGRSSASR